MSFCRMTEEGRLSGLLYDHFDWQEGASITSAWCNSVSTLPIPHKQQPSSTGRLETLDTKKAKGNVYCIKQRSRISPRPWCMDQADNSQHATMTALPVAALLRPSIAI